MFLINLSAETIHETFLREVNVCYLMTHLYLVDVDS